MAIGLGPRDKDRAGISGAADVAAIQRVIQVDIRCVVADTRLERPPPFDDGVADRCRDTRGRVGEGRFRDSFEVRDAGRVIGDGAGEVRDGSSGTALDVGVSGRK